MSMSIVDRPIVLLLAVDSPSEHTRECPDVVDCLFANRELDMFIAALAVILSQRSLKANRSSVPLEANHWFRV